MRTSHRCPKCQGEDLLVVDPWSQPDPGSSNTTSPTQVAFRMSYFRRQVATDLELWVCAGCGYAELFAKDVDTLGELAYEQNDSMAELDVFQRLPEGFTPTVVGYWELALFNFEVHVLIAE